jgi:hypothetical protein
LKLNRLHGVISQKMILFVTTAVETSNLTRLVPGFPPPRNGFDPRSGHVEFVVVEVVVGLVFFEYYSFPCLSSDAL